MTSVPFLRESAQGVFLSVKVQPRASRNRIQGIHGTELKVAIAAPPVNDAANEQLVHFLAEILQTSRGSVQIVRGHASRHKTILIKGLASKEILHRLGVP